MHEQERDTLKALFGAALAAVDPRAAVLAAMTVEGDRMIVAGEEYDLAAFERIVVVGAGKAAATMAQAVESLLDGRLAAGLVVVKTGHTELLSVIEQVEAAHPIPDRAGVEAAQRILGLVRAADENTLVICLLSGGASALLVAPVEGVTLADKQLATRLLLNAGATINELNAVRKHLSSVKGGGLAKSAYPARLLTLILSDVIGDSLDVIASGPTVADGSTYADAWAVVEKYGLQDELPEAVIDRLKRGMCGDALETVKAGDPCLARTQNAIVANLLQALEAARDEAVGLGLPVRLVSDSIQGEARAEAHFLAQTARAELADMKPGEQRCQLGGGETTVVVRGDGRGGRNQELALAFALEIDGVEGISLLSAGTDGTDGPTDAAGAMVDGRTAESARRLGLDPQASLDRNDSWTFFHEYDALSSAHSHLRIGPTGTNVMDVQIVLLEKPTN